MMRCNIIYASIEKPGKNIYQLNTTTINKKEKVMVKNGTKVF